MIRCALLAVIILTFGFGEAPAVCGDEYPPAPPGFWRDDPHDPVLRDVPSSVGLSQQKEADCSVNDGSFLPKYAQSKYDDCIRETVAAKRSNAAIAAKDDATCKSYALHFGTGDYAQCRENLVNQREANRRALIMAPP